MARRCTCDACGHQQYVGYQSVDGRLMWWTPCDKCGEANIGMAPPDPRVIQAMARAFSRIPTGGTQDGD